MAEPRHLPLPADSGRQPGDVPIGAGHRVPAAALVATAAVIAGTAVLGAATGFLWAALAPRALLIVVGHGSADVVNPETSAFIAADGWFTLLSVLGGVVSGLLGYVLAVRRYREPAMAGVLVGGLAAALIAMWIGQQSGKAAFNHSLALSQPGALLRAPLILGGHGALAFWPLAAGLTAGGIEAIILLRERRRDAGQRAFTPPLRPGPAVPSPGSAATGSAATGSPATASPTTASPATGGLAALAEPREPGQATDSRE